MALIRELDGPMGIAPSVAIPTMISLTWFSYYLLSEFRISKMLQLDLS